MKNIVIATLIAVSTALTFVAPAKAFIHYGDTHESCYEQSDGHGGTYYACSKD